MKKILFLSLIIIITTTSGHCAIKWWEQDTICRLDPTNCYPSMGIGFEPEFWDKTSQCWGQKIICGAALDSASPDNKVMTKKDITARTGISKDYDISSLNGDCFGVRKTSSNGLFATYNGKQVKVFCPGILERIYTSDETEKLSTGTILLSTKEPSCTDLSEYEYIGVKNGKCHGKKYERSKFYIDCENPDGVRLVIHNGADYTAPMGDAPTTIADAEKIFEDMFGSAQNLRTQQK